MTKKSALITGITGQDGSYLAELLLKNNYTVHGIVRRSSLFNRSRLAAIYRESEANDLHLHYGDLVDSSSLNRILEKIEPTEIYNLAAQSHVGISFDVPEYTADVDGLGTLRLLDALKNTQIKAKLYQASTSELYGKAGKVPQDELTPFYPRSPYAAAKLFAYWLVVNYREAYGIFASNGILFNHESPRRGENFVTRKITLSIVSILKGELSHLELGTLDVKRDWGYAPEYVDAMWRILQYHRPDDFVIATNETHTVREFVEEAFRFIGKEIVWTGVGVDERGVDRATDRVLVTINPKFYRPTEVDILQGDSSKAKALLNWQPKTRFKELVHLMVEAELRAAGLVNLESNERIALL